MRTIALFLLLVVPSVSFADTIHIPGDYPTIQGGIDAAVNGDVVLVAPGAYVENIDFLQEHLETFLQRGASEPGYTDWPCFVQRELKAFRDCGYT